MRRRPGLLLLILLAGLAAAGCAQQPAYPATPTKTPAPALGAMASTATPISATAPAADAETPEPPTVTPAVTGPTATGEPTAAGTLQESSGTHASAAPAGATGAAEDGTSELLEDHYWMQRPIGPTHRDYLDRTYPYGSTAGGRLRPHTGVEFFNPAGTPVLAVAGASVHYAGTDEETVYGPQPGFYGNLIVLELDGVSYGGQPVYALYGHLSATDVQAGEQVTAGQAIGAVGGTGIANGGAHLHFEVRVGDPLGYSTSTRNPDLWISPYPGYGTLAGRISGPDGAPLPQVAITVQGDDMVRYTGTYAGEENRPDDVFGENFTYGDLPQGWYNISLNSGRKIYRERVYVQAGRTSWIEIQFDE